MAGGLTGYDRAFVQVVEEAWQEALKSDPGAADEAKSSERHGQLDPSDPDLFALCDTYNYQRHHADACRQALREAGIESPRTGRPLVVIDIGAGACTVAVALGKTWPQELSNVHYYAVEPHPKMRALGMQIVDALNWPFGHFHMFERTDQLLEPANSRKPERFESARVLVTFNYVMQQGSVRRGTVSEWAGLLHGLVAHKASVELLIVTVRNPCLDDRTDALLRDLREVGVGDQRGCDRPFDFSPRYPREGRLSRESRPVSGVWSDGPKAKARCRSYVLSAV
ncbi:MAG: hypothetical protein OXH20_12905 [bacterium]|nr:hypothetical protein [bacterium]MDE0667730.1 hypothetical protein [bacterium]MYJ12894.1 hypothetical protein [Acidimicrobiia bacterium]